MNLNNYVNRHDLLIDWLLMTHPKGATVLDVGANDGSFCPEVRRIAERASTFAGVDPDAKKLTKHTFLTHRYEGTLEEASIPHNTFDIIYAIYVLEHVAKPEEFIRAAFRVLRPGGSFYFITPNGLHYFAAISSLLARLGLQESVLHLIRPTKLVDHYHYPAVYRLNTARTLMRLGRQAGFTQFYFKYSERLDELSCYFPGPLKILPWLWERMVQLSNSESLLCNLMGRMVK